MTVQMSPTLLRALKRIGDARLGVMTGLVDAMGYYENDLNVLDTGLICEEPDSYGKLQHWR